jgi:hypothetical protein
MSIAPDEKTKKALDSPPAWLEHLSHQKNKRNRRRMWAAVSIFISAALAQQDLLLPVDEKPSSIALVFIIMALIFLGFDYKLAKQ